jgi:predicted  nucleic acid-binding Zn-ribbon protein
MKDKIEEKLKEFRSKQQELRTQRIQLQEALAQVNSSIDQYQGAIDAALIFSQQEAEKPSKKTVIQGVVPELGE